VVISEEILDFVQGHVVGVARRPERPPNKIARAISRNDRLELGEIFWIQFVVFYEVRCGLRMCVRRKHADDLLFEGGQVVDEELGGGDALAVDQVQNKLQNIKFIEEAELGHNDGGFGELVVLEVLLRELQKIVLVHNVVHLHRLHEIEDHLRAQTA